MAENTPRDINLEISIAPSNRAKCQHCKEPIQQGMSRVAFPSRRNNITVAKYLHPACFATNAVAVDYAPTGRAKCKDTGREIAKGEPRCVLRLITCEGKPKDPRIYSPDAPFLVSFLRELLSLEEVTESTDSISLKLDAPAEHRRWVADAISGANVAGRPRPNKEAEPAPSKAKQTRGLPKPSAEAAPPPPKKKQRAARPTSAGPKDGDDGELVD